MSFQNARGPRGLAEPFLLAALSATLSACASAPARGGRAARTDAGARPAVARGVRPAQDARARSAAEEPELAAHAELALYLTYAEAHDPGLEAARQRWYAAEQQARRAGALPDPRFTWREQLEQVETRVGPQRRSFGLMQQLPAYGSLDAAERVERARAQAAQARYELARTDLRRELIEAFAAHYYLGRELDALRESVELYRYHVELLQVRLGVGRADQPDVLRVQVELGKYEDRLASALDHERVLVARLNAALGRPGDAPLTRPVALPAVEADLDEAALLAELPTSSPELRALAAEVDAARAGVELAETEKLPGWTLGVETIDTGAARTPGVAGSGDDPWIVSLSLDLPLQRARYRAGERAAEARQLAATRRMEDRLEALGAELERALYGLRDARRKVELYGESLVPKAQASLDATVAAYGAGTKSLLDLIDAQRVVLEFELAYEHARVDRLRERAAIERCTGRWLTATGTEAARPAGGESDDEDR